MLFSTLTAQQTHDSILITMDAVMCTDQVGSGKAGEARCPPVVSAHKAVVVQGRRGHWVKEQGFQLLSNSKYYQILSCSYSVLTFSIHRLT